MSDLVMPRLSDTMEEGTVLRWIKHDGEHVRRGEELVEIETDKATMAYESDREGILETVAREGDTLAVGELIARIGGGDGNGAPVTRPVLAEEPSPPAPETQPSAAPRGDGDRLKASPVARRIAGERGVDLRMLAGSGPGGRIVKADVEAAATGQTPAAGQAPTTERVSTEEQVATIAGVASSKGQTTTVELSRTQRTIARRMAESKATIPDFTLQADVDMERCVRLRTELKGLTQAGAAPTYNDMIVKACALALREHPRANGSYRDGRFELHSRVNVGVAVAVDSDEPLKSALVVPTVLDADVKSLDEIARETRALAERVRAGTITPPELSGGTFTVSNLGMYGVRSFTAIINPPQAAILAVGSVAPRAVADEEGGLVARHTMTVTLSCDHRILYGSDAALFLSRVRELLEEPAALG